MFGDFKDMGRTILSFSTHMQWRKRNRSHFAVLSKSDRKKFDDDIMFEIPRLYIFACSYAVQPVRLYPILCQFYSVLLLQTVDGAQFTSGPYDDQGRRLALDLPA